MLQRQPVIDAQTAAKQLHLSARNVQLGIDHLVEDGILQQIGAAARSRLYEAPEVLAALDRFASRAKRGRWHRG